MSSYTVTREPIIRSVEAIHFGPHSAKYLVTTWHGRSHDLCVFQRGGADSMQFGFEIDGDIVHRGCFLSEAAAFAAAMDTIRSSEVVESHWLRHDPALTSSRIIRARRTRSSSSGNRGDG